MYSRADRCDPDASSVISELTRDGQDAPSVISELTRDGQDAPSVISELTRDGQDAPSVISELARVRAQLAVAHVLCAEYRRKIAGYSAACRALKLDLVAALRDVATAEQLRLAALEDVQQQRVNGIRLSAENRQLRIRHCLNDWDSSDPDTVVNGMTATEHRR